MRYERRHPPHSPGSPRGTVTLDGRDVADLASFFCALGEAVNGPGGYFGANFMALDECLRGGYGASPGFTLTWYDAQVARSRLGAVMLDTTNGPMS